jgi:2,4-diketo-3-deoxy-L-fuconate hydrolase
MTFRLARAEMGGEDAVVVRRGDEVWRLRDLLPGTEAARCEAVDDCLVDWDGWLDAIERALHDVNAGTTDPTALHWRVPLRRTRKLICIGANYDEHVTEMHRGEKLTTTFPYSFVVPPTTTLSASGEEVRLPKSAAKIDWEGEIGVVIGRRARDVPVERALEIVACYTSLNDLSARDWAGPNAPAIGVDWVMSKAYDGFKPIGPDVLPSRFVADPQELSIRTWVNGELKQDGVARNMIFSVAEIIAHLSGIMTLEPGDVIATGTPDGVGHGRRPPEYLAPGDHVVVEVSGLERLETRLV